MFADTSDTTVIEHVPGQLAADLDDVDQAPGYTSDDDPDAPSSTMRLPVRILVLQRGWVVIGRYHALHDDETGQLVEVLLTEAQVIRRWGTTRGLGELVDGPKENTVLDPAGVVRVHPLAVVMQIQANAQAWQDNLK